MTAAVVATTLNRMAMTTAAFTIVSTVYAPVVEQWASNPEVDGAFCGLPWHSLQTQAICGGGDCSRLLTLSTTEPFACRCPNVNKMLQMCEKKSRSVIQLAQTFGGQISSHFFQ